METANSPTQQKYQWRTLILFGLLAIPATLAILPYSIAISGPSMAVPPPENSSLSPETMRILFLAVMVLITLGQAVLINIPLTALGLLFAKWTGLDAPFIRAVLYRQPKPARFGRAMLVGAVSGAAAGGLLLLLSQFVFGPWMDISITAAGISVPEVHWSWWEGLLASLSAGFNEEVWLRLFLLNGLAWSGGLLFGKKTGRPGTAPLWAANVLSTLVFGALHISNILVVGMPVDVVTVTSTLVLNGIIGILFGWLYWKYGLESAMVSHFAADLILKVVLVFFL
ncbi:MAG: CPBP family intramembrane glutamic endopeptidase [Anaerolineales bacterium]